MRAGLQLVQPNGQCKPAVTMEKIRVQYYTESRENAYLDGKGSLVIKTIKQDIPVSY